MNATILAIALMATTHTGPDNSGQELANANTKCAQVGKQMMLLGAMNYDVRFTRPDGQWTHCDDGSAELKKALQNEPHHRTDRPAKDTQKDHE